MENSLESLVASGVTAPSDVSDVTPEKSTAFRIPLVVPIGVPSGDGRSFKEGSLSVADFPLPLLWQTASSSSGHDGSYIVGRIDSAKITDKGIEDAEGVFDSGPYGQEARRMVMQGFLSKVSGDFDNFSYQVNQEAVEDFTDKVTPKKIEIDKARLIGVTIVAKPAFQEASIILSDEELTSEADETLVDGDELSDKFTVLESDENPNPGTITASADIPVVPPREWFQDPKLTEATAMTILDSGQVFGHLALWETSHIGMNGKVRPPRSRSDYKYFRSGVVRTDDGTDVTVGQLTLTHGHADLHLDALSTKKHYDDTKSAVVDIVTGEDEFGIWFAGALRPDITEYQLRSLRASGVSGDWRPINGRLEMVGLCAVPVSGFPVTRAMVASASQEMFGLVAAGSFTLATMKMQELDTPLEARVNYLESQLSLMLARDDIEYVKELALSHKEDLARKAKNAMEVFE